MPNVAAIDVGSNAMRLLIAAVDKNQKIETVETLREPVRLGADVFSSGYISRETIERAAEAFQRFKDKCDQHKVAMIRTVGTSALREAANGPAVIERIAAQTGLRIGLIGGEEEARLVQLAVAREVEFSKKLAVVIDIGGGSTEVSLVLDGDIIVSDSHKMGAVRLLRLLEEEKYSFKIFARLVSDYVKGLRRQLKREIGNRKVDLCVGTGGNFESLGSLRVTLLGRDSRERLSLKELEEIMEKINSMSVTDRIKQLKLRPDRADVIAPAAAIIRQIMVEADVREVVIPHVGLKEGLVVDMLPNLTGGKREIRRRQVLAFAQELGRKYGYDERHGTVTARFAVELFDQLASLHKLDAEYRLILEVGALLHDIGQFISVHDHHKHSQYLLRSTPFIGLDGRQREIAACLARYHRKAAPVRDHEWFRELSASDREAVEKLSAILRIADALDREQGRAIDGFEVQVKGSGIKITLKGEGDLLLEKWALKKKAEVFEEVFKMKVEVLPNGD